MRFLIFSLLVVGCGASVESPSLSEPREAGTEAGAETSTSAACCPISPAPSCCMAFGGSSDWCAGRDLTASMVCDNLPDPSDSRWERRIDEKGCPLWYAPPSIPMACNPSGVRDTGPDSGGESDAGADARKDETCTWKDDAGSYSELCKGSYGCCAASSTGTRCVPRGAGTPCY